MRPGNQKLADHVASSLRSHILGHELIPGTRLPSETELIEKFEVSRATVREAIRLLERDHLVVVRPGPGGGIFSTLPKRDDLVMTPAVYLTASRATVGDFVSFRKLIEPEIARLAARNATDVQRERLLHEAAQPLGSGGEHSTGRFHDLLARATNNRVIDTAVAFLCPAIDLTMAPSLATKHDSSTTSAAHRKIARAVQAGDEAGAANAMLVHIEAYEKFMQDHELDQLAVLPPRQWLSSSGNPLESPRVIEST